MSGISIDHILLKYSLRTDEDMALCMFDTHTKEIAR
jgi:hypothetical protein